eukprot:6172996-Pleurochrysis_carterae.AAC.10
MCLYRRGGFRGVNSANEIGDCWLICTDCVRSDTGGGKHAVAEAGSYNVSAFFLSALLRVSLVLLPGDDNFILPSRNVVRRIL